MITDNIINNITAVFHKHERSVLFAYLFGSTVHAEGRLSGDIDVAVYFAEGTPEAHFENRLSLYADICRALKRNDVDLVVLNTTLNLILLDDIVRTGDVIYVQSERTYGFRTQRSSSVA